MSIVSRRRLSAAIGFFRGITLGVLVLLAGCGGGGGDSSTSTSNNSSGGGTTTTAGAIDGFFVDGPVSGLSYSCSPSGMSGVTTSTGAFSCRAGDTITFTISVGNGTLNLGSVAVPSTTGVSMPVTMLPHGMQVAEILHALNHGTTANMDLSNLRVPTLVIAEINNYIAGGGTLPTNQTSDDGFLAHVQGQTTDANGRPPAFANAVSGAGTTFMRDTVVPNLQNTIVQVSATNPAPPIVNNATKLSGSMVVNGSGTISVPGCTTLTWSANGGGILNAVVNGNLQVPGTYAATFTSGTFNGNVAISSVTCGSAPNQVTVPGSDTPITQAPLNGGGTITVASAFSGTTLTINNSAFVPPAGCSGGNALTGTNVGVSNPLVTLTQSLSCDVSGQPITLTTTIKMVGAW